MIEFDLRIPVAKWLLSRGLSPICEVQSLRNCDLIGVAFTDGPRPKLCRMVAVELKLERVAEVIGQCRRHQPFATETWAAMPPVSGKAAEKFLAAGVGLLCVDGGTVAEVIPSPVHEGRDLRRWHRVARNRRDEHKWRMKHPRMIRLAA